MRTLQFYEGYRRIRHIHEVLSVAPEAEPASSECRVSLQVGDCLEYSPCNEQPRLATGFDQAGDRLIN